MDLDAESCLPKEFQQFLKDNHVEWSKLLEFAVSKGIGWVCCQLKEVPVKSAVMKFCIANKLQLQQLLGGVFKILTKYLTEQEKRAAIAAASLKVGTRAAIHTGIETVAKKGTKTAAKTVIKTGTTAGAKVSAKSAVKSIGAVAAPVGIIADITQAGLEIAGYKKKNRQGSWCHRECCLRSYGWIYIWRSYWCFCRSCSRIWTMGRRRDNWTILGKMWQKLIGV